MNGLHAIIEANGPIAHLGAAPLVTLMTQAAQAAGATVLQSYVHEFGPGFGNTGVVLLAESHISVHTWPEHHYAAFDIFMCGEINLNNALEVLQQACPTSELYSKVLQRGRPLPNKQPQVIACELLKNLTLKQAWLANTATPEAELVSAATELVKFLLLCCQAQKTLIPPASIKALWRELVLCTQCYEAFCQQYLSRFVHYQNTPNTMPCPVTQAYYIARFGQPNTHYWPINSSTTHSRLLTPTA